MVSILLQDEHTGERRPAHRVAADWIFANNENRDDARLGQLARELVDGKNYDEQLYRINMRRREMRERMGSDYVSNPEYRRENALLNDLSAYVELTHRIRQAGNDAASIEVSGMRGLVIAADNNIVRVMRERNVADEVQRRGQRSPEQAAMEEIVSESYRPRVQAVLDQFDGQNLTNAAILNRLENMQSGNGWFGESWNKAQALRVFRRQMELEGGAQAEAPRGARVQVPDAPAPAGDNRSVNESINEILGTAGAGLMNPARTDHNEVRRQAIAIVRRHQGAIHGSQEARDRVYAELVRAYDAGNSTEALANGYALDVLMRSVQRENARERGQSVTPFNRETFLREATDHYLPYARNPAEWRRQHEQQAPATGQGQGQGPGQGAGGDNGRARLYRFGTQAAPPENEIPVLAQNQVQTVQQLMLDAGISFERGADGKYGPNTHRALKAFAASLQPAIDLTQADFTQLDANGIPTDPEARAIWEALAARRQGQGQGQGDQAPAAGADPALTAEGQRLQAAVQEHRSVSDAATPIRALVPAEFHSVFDTAAALPAAARDPMLRELLKSQMGLTDAEIATLQITGEGANLQVSGEAISNMERAINSLPGGQQMAVDGVFDARLGAILGETGILDVLRAAITNPQALTVAAAGAPGATPNGGQGQGQGQGQG